MIATYEHIWFDSWKSWSVRDKPSLDPDVPKSFGIFGIYLLAKFDSPPIKKEIEFDALPKEIVYIGMSSHVDRRLERSHSAVKKYREETSGDRCANLWYARAYSSWSNGLSSKKAVASAYIAYYERALILQYTLNHGALPMFNRR